MDNDQLLNEIKGLLEGMEQRFDSKLATLKEELREYVYDAETSVLCQKSVNITRCTSRVDLAG
jgi:hypothetical protein